MIAMTSDEARTVQRALVAEGIKRSTILAPRDLEPLDGTATLHSCKRKDRTAKNWKFSCRGVTEVKENGKSRLRSVLTGNSVSTTRYNTSMSETKPFRLTESVKAAG